MTKEDELRRRLAELEYDNRQLKADSAAFKKWKEKCDRAALKWGSFAMGVLTLGAILVTGIDALKGKVTALLTMWMQR